MSNNFNSKYADHNFEINFNKTYLTSILSTF